MNRKIYETKMFCKFLSIFVKVSQKRFIFHIPRIRHLPPSPKFRSWNIIIINMTQAAKSLYSLLVNYLFISFSVIVFII